MSWISANLRVYVAITAETIFGFIRGVKTETVLIIRIFNKVFWAIPVLLWVILSRSLANLNFSPLEVAVFNSYPTSLIVVFSKLVTVLTSLFEFSSLSLTNIAFKFPLYILNTRINASAVNLLASVIASSYYFLLTFNIASQIFTFDTGVLLQSS